MQSGLLEFACIAFMARLYVAHNLLQLNLTRYFIYSPFFTKGSIWRPGNLEKEPVARRTCEGVGRVSSSVWEFGGGAYPT